MSTRGLTQSRRAGRSIVAMDNPNVVVVRGLRKSYGGRTVVDGLDLDVVAGEIVGLIGVNGATATTQHHGVSPADGYFFFLKSSFDGRCSRQAMSGGDDIVYSGWRIRHRVLRCAGRLRLAAAVKNPPTEIKRRPAITAGTMSIPV